MTSRFIRVAGGDDTTRAINHAICHSKHKYSKWRDGWFGLQNGEIYSLHKCSVLSAQQMGNELIISAHRCIGWWWAKRPKCSISGWCMWCEEWQLAAAAAAAAAVVALSAAAADAADNKGWWRGFVIWWDWLLLLFRCCELLAMAVNWCCKEAKLMLPVGYGRPKLG